MSVAADSDFGASHKRPQTNQKRLLVAGSLPDLQEPAPDPNHLQFFHSVAFGLIDSRWPSPTLSLANRRALAALVRGGPLIAGGAYMMHLAMNTTTEKSLPLIGRI